MQLYLIRHAQSQNNAWPEGQRVEDPALTELGHQQAARLAEALPALELTHLITSPFRRTLETTEHVRRAVDLIPEVRPELHELGGCMRGPSVAEMVGAPGLNRDEIIGEFPNYRVCESIDGKGWWGAKPYELHQAAQARAKDLLERTRREFATTAARVAYVMHADFKSIFLQQFYDVAQVPWNASVTRLTISGEEIRVDDFNNVAHLPEELRTA